MRTRRPTRHAGQRPTGALASASWRAVRSWDGGGAGSRACGTPGSERHRASLGARWRVAQEAVVPDPHEPLGSDVEREAAEAFTRLEGHGGEPIARR
jgi:hypothetical protein